ncbi:MAG: SMC-Scp complex subunit ScpB, partial [Oligoflexia bacterium]|nr:SMC-Scp complex subunit ScpB [Oligoflexia bacterium]
VRGGVSEETIWAIIEAYLFEVNRSATLQDFVDLFKDVFTAEELETTLRRMEKSKWDAKRGIILVCRRGLWALEVLITHLKVDPKTLKDEGNLLLELSDGEKTILTIIVYEEQVTLSRINEVMGTDCGHYLISLQEHGLVMKRGNKFLVTPSFYGFIGIKDLSELQSLDIKDDTKIQNNIEDNEMNFDDFDCVLIEEKKVRFNSQWLVEKNNQ